MLVLDEAHPIFNLARIRTLLLKSIVHPKVFFLSASGEGSASSPTTPIEIVQKFFRTPTIPEVDDHFINQLEQAGVRLDKDSVEFFMKFCGGHKSIFMAAMTWVGEKQNGVGWNYIQAVTNVRKSMFENWLAPGSILNELA